jgi:Tfp pilus assembly PilM family ATPase
VRTMIRQLAKRKATRAVGLDLGQSALRVAGLRQVGDRWLVEQLAACRRRAPDRGGDESGFAERARRWIEQQGLRGRDVVAGMSPPDIELHSLEIPSDRTGADAIIREELARLCAFEPADTTVDHWPLTGEGAGRSAIGVAARGERVADLLNLCETARLDCRQIDATPCALARFGAVFRGRGAATEDVWSVLDLGGRMSRLVMCVGTMPILARTFANGGWRWTEKLAESLGVTAATAERQKCDHGIACADVPAGGNEDRRRSTAALQEMVFNVLRGDLDEMCAELERSYRYVLQTYRGRAPGPVILVGGGAALLGLDALMQAQLGTEVIAAGNRRPEGCRFDFGACDAQTLRLVGEFAGAIGLALPEGARDA